MAPSLVGSNDNCEKGNDGFSGSMKNCQGLLSVFFFHRR